MFVHEARNLFGGNLHPVTNVNIGKMGKHTRVQRSTAKPKWEEVGTFTYFLQKRKIHVFENTMIQNDMIVIYAIKNLHLNRTCSFYRLIICVMVFIYFNSRQEEILNISITVSA